MRRFPLVSVLFSVALIGIGLSGCSADPPDHPDPGRTAGTAQAESPPVPAALDTREIALQAAKMDAAALPQTASPPSPFVGAPDAGQPHDAEVFDLPDLQTSRSPHEPERATLRAMPPPVPESPLFALGVAPLGLAMTRPMRFGPSEDDPGDDEDGDGDDSGEGDGDDDDGDDDENA